MYCQACGMDFEDGEEAVRVQSVEMVETIDGSVEMKPNGWTGSVTATYHRECYVEKAEPPVHRTYGVATARNGNIHAVGPDDKTVCGTIDVPPHEQVSRFKRKENLMQAIECDTCKRVLNSRW